MAASADLLVRIRADASQASAALSSIQSQITAAGRTIGGGAGGGANFAQQANQVQALGEQYASTARAGILFAAVGASIDAAFVGGVKTGADFQTAMTRIEALTGTSAAQMMQFNEQVLAMSGSIAKSPKDLADALYFVVSAGFQGADALRILDISAKGAVGGLGETKVVADAVTSVLNAYSMGADQAAHVTDVFLNAVTRGKMEPAALAANLGKVVEFGAAAGVSIEEVTANIATMSRAGATVPQAVTGLVQVLSTIEKPAPKTIKALKEIGMSIGDLRGELKQIGLGETILDIVAKTGGDEDKLAAIFGNIRALRDVLGTARLQAGAYRDVLGSMGNVAGLTENAFATMNQTINVQAQLLSNAVQIIEDKFVLLVGGPLTAVLSFARQVVTAFGALPEPIQAGAIALLGLVGVAATVAGAFIFFAPAIAALPLAFTAVGTAVGVIIPALVALAPIVLGVIAAFAGITLVVTHWTEARTIIAGALNAIADAVPAVLAVLAVLSSPLVIIGFLTVQLARTFIENWPKIRDAVATAVTGIIGFLGNLVAAIGGTLGPIFNVIGDALGGVAKQLGAGFNTAVDQANTTLGGIPGGIQTALRGAADAVDSSTWGTDLVTQAQDTVAGVNAAMSGGRASTIPTSETGIAHVGTDIVDAQGTSLDFFKNRLQDAQDKLNDVQTAASRAATQGLRPFAAEIDSVDKAIAKIELSRLEKTYDRLQRHPARTQGAQLGRLHLEREILQREQIIATPLREPGAGSEKRNPEVIAAKAQVDALKDKITQMEREKKLWAELKTAVDDYYLHAKVPGPGRVNPYRDFASVMPGGEQPYALGGAPNWTPIYTGPTVAQPFGGVAAAHEAMGEGDSGVSATLAGLTANYPSVAASTTNNTTTNVTATLQQANTINKEVDAQTVLDLIAQWFANLTQGTTVYSPNSASESLAGVRKSN